jgi:hypothetical protein
VSIATIEPENSVLGDCRATADRCAELETRLRALAAEIAAAQAEFLGLLEEYDTLEGWAEWGVRSAAEWLSNHCGHGAYTARKEVALAHRLGTLPVLRHAMARGAISIDKASAVAALADADSEAELVDLAQETTANQLARLAAAARRAIDDETDDADAERRARSLKMWWDASGMLALRGRLPAEQGALIYQAVQKAKDINRRMAASAGFDGEAPEPGSEEELVDPLADADDPHAAGCADALAAMAETFLDQPPVADGGDHYLVVVHVDATALADDGDGRCHIEGGPALSVEVVRRLACGASLVWLAEDRDANPVAVSAKTADIPTSVRRAVRARDGGCVFPTGTGGTCGRPAAWSHVHHVEHRAHGGRHSTANCFTLCPFHHHLVHEGRFRMTIGPDGQPDFARPDGTAIANQRPNLFDDCPPPRTARNLEPDISWARSGGAPLDLPAAVDAVLNITGQQSTGHAQQRYDPGIRPAPGMSTG